MSAPIGNANEVVIQDEYAFVLESGEGLWVVDITDRANPESKGFHDVGGSAGDLVIRDNYAYIAGGRGGLYVVDISNPLAPQEVGSVAFDQDGSAWDVDVVGDYAYVADYRNGLRVVDIRDPSNPVEVGSFTTESRIDHFFNVTAAGNTAYLTASGALLYVLDVSDPSNPTLLTTLNNVSMPIAKDTLLYLKHTELVGSNYIDYFRILDVSDPSNPVERGVIENWNFSGGNIDIVDNYAFISGIVGQEFSNLQFTVVVIDISTPTNPVEVDRKIVAWEAWDIAGTGTDMFLADGYGGLMALSLQKAATPSSYKIYLPLLTR